MSSDIALTSYAAKKCARRTHNEYAGLPQPERSAQADVFIEAGRDFEILAVGRMVEAFAAAGRSAVTVLPTRLGGVLPATELLVLAEEPGEWEANVDATVAALEAGVPVIVGGRLPDTGPRRGAPDILVAVDGGYAPIDIKGHKTFKPSTAKDPARAGSVTLSMLADPAARREVRGGSGKAGHAAADCMQLSHYVRMLEDLGCAPEGSAVWAGILGNSDLSELAGDDLAVVWYDLAEGGEQSALARYDVAFGFRVGVAEAARAGREAVRPFRITECGTCEWFPVCESVVGPDDASFAIATRLPTVEEWESIYPADRRLTVEELADLPRSSLPEDRKWTEVLRRARMTVAGIDFEPHGGPDGTTEPVPIADLEIDFDIEWDSDGRIYQWGIRVRDGQDDDTARYLPGLVSFDPLDDDSETQLAAECLRTMRALTDQAEHAGKSVTIFHWSDPERSRSGRQNAAVGDLVKAHGVDLRRWAERNLFSRAGYSLKAIAPACGFTWRGDDAGGLASQMYLAVAREGGPDAAAAKAWCLDYNEDDVAAQAAIRDEWSRRYG